MLHRLSRNLLNPLERSRLKGLLGFSVASEPQFIGRLREKYGSEIVDAALTFHAPLRREVAQYAV